MNLHNYIGIINLVAAAILLEQYLDFGKKEWARWWKIINIGLIITNASAALVNLFVW